MDPRPPIIVTGAHRSGTTLLVRLLRELGCFFGARHDPNEEAFYFLRRNEWVMRRAGGAWDYPDPTVRFLDHEPFLREVRDIFARHLGSFWFSRFTGYRSFLRHGRVPGAGRPWGWKDPRNVFTMRIWESIFPDACLIYVRRNGVDVASSLRQRMVERLRSPRPEHGNLHVRPLLARLREAIRPFESFDHYLYSTRCLTLEDSFSLWEDYVAEGERMFERFAGPKLALTFEQMLERPVEHLERLDAFLEWSTPHERLEALARGLQADRASAFRSDGRLTAFYDRVRTTPWMQKLGYGALLDPPAPVD